MNRSIYKHPFILFISSVVVLASLQGGSCRSGGGGLPAVTTKDYKEAVRAFFVGVAALQAGDNARAQKELEAASKLAPDEPAIWADLGLLSLRGSQLDAAGKHFETALKLAPDDPAILVLDGICQSRKGKFAEAAADFKKAAEKDPRNLRARYALVEQIQQQGGPDSDAQTQKLLKEIVDSNPNNLTAILELARASAKVGDGATLNAMVRKLEEKQAGWNPMIKEQLSALQKAAAGPNPRQAASAVIFVQNVLKPEPEYQSSFVALKTPVGEVGEPLVRLLKLQNPPITIAASDDGITFTAIATPADSAKSDVVGVAYLSNEGKPAIVAADGHNFSIASVPNKLPFPGGPAGKAPSAHGFVAADLNNDFKTDFALAGAGGLKLYEQQADGSFKDVTAKAKLPAQVTGAAYYGVWAADIDLDGDLDLITAQISGPVQVLQNNGDGTFKPITLFAGVTALRDFKWADLDSDGDPDAVFLDNSGKLRVFFNERAGRFTERELPAEVGQVAAIAILDANDDGLLDVVALKQEGSLIRISYDAKIDKFSTAILGRSSDVTALNPESARLFTADFDNNGGIDLLVSTAAAGQLWLHGDQGVFKSLPASVAGKIYASADLAGNGRQALVGVSADGKPVSYANAGKKNYGWQVIRPIAVTANGDQRINSFGIGGDIEIRAGYLTQKQPINTPVVHFGLGDSPTTDAARIFWPNGMMQAEFGLTSGQSVKTTQRLKGSCPWVFAWNGKNMGFVTDFIWRSPLGLRINAQDTGKVAMTEDWVKIRGDQLVPRDGYYDIRITAELWETHFFDNISLLTLDHPAGTEMYVDERFAIPPPSLGTTFTGPSRPFAQAHDDNGADVSGLVNTLDSRYLDNFGRGRYQGVTRDHFVEVELGVDAPKTGPLWLIAQGWIHPTDSSINVAIAQGNHDKPRGLSLEVADAKGGWVVAKPNLGFPAGKNKTILVNLEGVFRPGAPRRARLRTNLEIYWDRLAWAPGVELDEARIVRTMPSTAELQYRGFSNVTQANASSPELPDYENIAGTTPRWCDLVGFCTRFGDVKELLASVDDRYVIMNAGDEMRLRFPSTPAPPAGWVRDFVLVGDGWEKDGDFNTGFSKTVLPLPSHSRPEYNTPPGRLEDDPIYKQYPQDWQKYHTRYVTPAPYWSALRGRPAQ